MNLNDSYWGYMKVMVIAAAFFGSVYYAAEAYKATHVPCGSLLLAAPAERSKGP